MYSSLEVENSSTLFRVLRAGNVLHDSRTVQVESLSAPVPAHCSISGKVVYEDINQANQQKGAYGAYAILLFRKPAGGPFPTPPCVYATGFQPTLYHPVQGWTEGIHYAKIELDGSFSFSFYAPIGYWNHYVDAEIFVTNWNDATYLMNETSDSDSTGGISLYTWSGTGFPGNMQNPPSALTTFRNAYSWCGATGAGNTLNYSGIKILLNGYDGSFLRNFQFAQEFDQQRLGYTPPRARTHLAAYPASTATAIASSTKIQFRKPSTAASSIGVIAHEFGHWYMYKKPMGHHDWAEGWAEFHASAVLHWVPGEYGDDAYFWKDDHNIETFWSTNPRWKGTGYPMPMGIGFASFLWNVYDTYYESEFEYYPIGVGDNEDVGEPDILIPLVNQTNYYPADLLEDLKEAVSPNWPIESDKAQSIQALYDCMMDPDINPPSFSLMLPPQIKNLQGELVSLFPSYELTWELQSYSGTAQPWYNIPEGIRIYQYDGISSWDEVDEVDGDATSAEIFLGDNDFIVTAYNSAGESSDAEMILDVQKSSINGAVVLDNIQLLVTPNIIEGNGRILVSGTFPESNGYLLLISSTGQTVKVIHEGKVNTNTEFDVNFDGLSKGVYFVTLDILGRKFFTKLRI